ncbi:DUF983 domain-containing protein [Phreatobacter aquaticus]|uniref:DUF983 domain-containing protein n=1 Tax=Phreatobacter aquaticus TaxID=2570229 RepID=A0A4D7QQX2_9HYPH|nr:DUF983 domain-containing protein [Phreatobacter aquaticus]QCK87644.1 DUF983 domain-containing protein [Phreatobacter aquaticus]
MSVQVLKGEPIVIEEPPARSAWQALGRGLRCRCPNCGEGRIFKSYLKVAPACTACGEAFHHHRADDAPPYLTILIVGHVIVPLLMWVELHHEPALWIHFILWLPLTLILCLALLPPLKGAVIGWQWALRMHGFDENSPEAKEAPPRQ